MSEQWESGLLALCVQAGDAIVAHYTAPGAEDFHAKSDNSPVTQADLAAHDVLVPGLERLTALPVLSEESEKIPLSQRRDWQRFWLIDPLDGTKEFLQRTGEFTINIALIEGSKPVLGLIYLPLAKRVYFGRVGTGAWRQDLSASDDRIPLATRCLPQEAPLVVLSSRRHKHAALRQAVGWLEATHGKVQRRDSGSALKFCQLVDGQGDVYPRFAPCSEWDTAAGQALLEAAGGSLVGLDGAPLTYNQRESLLNPWFYALADPSAALWQDFLRQDFTSSTE